MDKRRREVLNILDDTLQFMVDQGTISLTVHVTTKDQAEELMAWMYSDTKPMTSELIELGWDKKSVSNDEYELLQHIKRVIKEA